MTVIFEVVDPTGRTVVCTEQAWKEHILAFHPYMAGHEAEVRAAIEAPMFGIFADAKHADRRIYYRRRNARTYVKVVVQFSEEH